MWFKLLTEQALNSDVAKSGYNTLWHQDIYVDPDSFKLGLRQVVNGSSLPCED